MKTGTEFMPVRHCSPFCNWNSRAMLRTGVLASGAAGLLPGMAKRPTTGVRPGANTAARDTRAPLPLLSNQPSTQSPLA